MNTYTVYHLLIGDSPPVNIVIALWRGCSKNPWNRLARAFPRSQWVLIDHWHVFVAHWRGENPDPGSHLVFSLISRNAPEIHLWGVLGIVHRDFLSWVMYRCPPFNILPIGGYWRVRDRRIIVKTTSFVVRFVIVSTLWHVVKATKDNKKSFDLWQPKFPELIVFYERKNGISAYSLSWFRPFLHPLKDFLATEYKSSGGQESACTSVFYLLQEARQYWPSMCIS